MKKYDQAFKREAIRKIHDGQSVASLARELGVSEGLLHKWKKDAVETASDSYIEGYDNRERRHSALGYKSPEEFARECKSARKDQSTRVLCADQLDRLTRLRSRYTGYGSTPANTKIMRRLAC